MTQAFNLSQLANKVNTSGKLDVATGAFGILSTSNGGTGLSTLTANNVLLGNGTGTLQSVAPGTTGNVLTSNGTTWVSAAGSSYVGPNCAVFSASGSFSVPAGITQIIVIAVGGGGGGITGSGAGGWGGGGGLAIAECTNVSGTLTVTVGAAGAKQGGAGTASTVTGTNVSVTATGGAGGSGASNGAGGTGTVTTGTALRTVTGWSGQATGGPEYDNPAYFLNGRSLVATTVNTSISWDISSQYRPGGRGQGINQVSSNSGGGVSGAVIIIY